jgi:outer membrane protein OmpA-like peptidoglycan-associated protein
MKRTNYMIMGAALFVAACVSMSATAGQLVTSDDLITQLTPKGERGLASVGIVGPTIDLTIQFEFNSAKLTTAARQQLDNVGTALSSQQLESFNFLLVGHTDSIGSNSYNLSLSEKRAASARAYLADKYGLGDARLYSLGMGENTLLYLDDPENGDNRRVEVRNIGDSKANLLRGGAGSAPIVNTNTITSATSNFCLTEGTRPEFAVLRAPAVDQPIIVRRRTAPTQIMNGVWKKGSNTFAWPRDWPLPEEGRYIWALGSSGTTATKILFVEGDPITPRDRAATYYALGCEAQVVAAFNEIVAQGQ